MKGVILAGGTGTRLYPLTRITNKHLLPVYNKPMIYNSLGFIKACGIKDIAIVVGKEHAGAFAELLGNGNEYGVNLVYVVQEEARGIAHALSLLKPFFNKEPIVTMLGDNIFNLTSPEFNKVKEKINSFDNNGAMVFLKKVKDPRRYGVAIFNKTGSIIRIKEKPTTFKSKYAVTGLYVYDFSVFEKISRLKPSQRNELEVTDINNLYIKESILKFHVLNGKWSDAGTFESLYEAAHIARDYFLRKNKGKTEW